MMDLSNHLDLARGDEMQNISLGGLKTSLQINQYRKRHFNNELGVNAFI